MRMTSKEMEKLPEIELIRIVNDPNSPEVDYNIAAEILIKKYEKMIHYHWWKLQKELNNTGYVNSIKEDFYDEAYEALLKAITKVDLNRIENDNFKILQLASWYITNVRTKMRKRVLTRVSKNKGLVAVNLDDGEDTNVIDSEVEKAYNDEFGYRTDPVYSYEVKEKPDHSAFESGDAHHGRRAVLLFSRQAGDHPGAGLPVRGGSGCCGRGSARMGCGGGRADPPDGTGTGDPRSGTGRFCRGALSR